MPSILPYLDPGVRDLVAALQAHGFATTDSGDGESKAALIAEGYAMPFLHVFMTVDPALLRTEADRLQSLLPSLPLGGRSMLVEASYRPADGVCVLALVEAE